MSTDPSTDPSGPTVVVVGGGPAGLAAAVALRARGVDVLVLDAGERAGSSWAAHYDTLRLNTVARTSHLPGLRFGRAAGPYPGRDQVVDYLDRYVRRHDLDVRWATRVYRIDPVAGAAGPGTARWLVHTDGRSIEATDVVIATGSCGVPRFPDWPGRGAFTGRVLHSSGYGRADSFAGRRVLVVGGGNSAGEIAADLVVGGAADVRLSVRTPVQVVPRRVFGVPTVLAAIATRRLPPVVGDTVVRGLRRAVLGDLPRHGLPVSDEPLSAQYARGGVVPLSHPGFFAELRAGRITVVPAVEDLTPTGARLVDGSVVDVDDVIAATGYETGLEPLLAGLGVLGETGRPLSRRGRTAPDAARLYAVGFADPLSGNLREIRIEARHVARAIARGHRTDGTTAGRGRTEISGAATKPRRDRDTRSGPAADRVAPGP